MIKTFTKNTPLYLYFLMLVVMFNHFSENVHLYALLKPETFLKEL